jgi:PKD domain
MSRLGTCRGASTDRHGTIANWAWGFGDGTSGSGKATNHDYPKAGNYTLTLTVTDNAGASAVTSRRINPISLSARGFKQNGQQKVDLSWNGVAGTSFDVYRDGAKIAAVQATAYTDVSPKGPGSHSYRVCASAEPTCSSDATVTF